MNQKFKTVKKEMDKFMKEKQSSCTQELYKKQFNDYISNTENVKNTEEFRSNI